MTRLLAPLALAFLAPAVGATPPNVVMIIGDDQAWSDYGFMGHPHIQTPHLDKLAAESLVFKRGYVPSSLCRASLATMITGLYPHQHNVTSNDPSLPPGQTMGQAMKDPTFLAQRKAMAEYIEKAQTLPRLLAERGYVSHQSGKWWEENACRCGGFTEGMTHGDTAKGGRHGDVGLEIGRKGLQPVTDFIDRAKADNKPFYVWYAPMMPHTPHNPPERLFEKYKDQTPSPFVAKYWAMCEWFDETVGELLGHLEKSGLAENTLVIYLHDNGWIQDLDRNGFAPKSKRSPYDGGLRTPILIRWPGKVPPGESAALAHSIDLVPTILHAAGVKPPADLPGLNLLDTEAVAGRDAVFGATFTHNAIDIHRPAANLEYRWVVAGNWKLLVPHAANVPNGAVELYDLAADPTEETNLAARHPQQVEALRKRLDAWWKP
jgi:arylsulfatase A-like enzyme